MSRLGTELPKEYSDRFDELRQNRVEVSYYKYGTASDNFGMKHLRHSYVFSRRIYTSGTAC